MLKDISRVPRKPGVYLFRDRDNRILYVGKAKELRNRLRSYFQSSAALDMRKTAMVRSVADFEYTVTGNELEAFVLEANLIKQYKPRYNILLRDDKNYPYLKLTLNEEWPRLEVVRRIRKDGAKYYGPYIPSGNMWNILSFIRNNFHLRNCRHTLEKRLRPCIQHQIKKCLAPCAGLVRHKDYMKMIAEIRLLLEGRNENLLKSLEREMKRLSEKTRYEEAAVMRDRIKAIQKISESQKVVAPGLGDVDVIGFYRKEDNIAFKIFFIRNGLMIGSKDFHLRDISGDTDRYLMKNFIEQFYSREIIPAAEIVCSVKPEDSEIIESWLSSKKTASVRIISAPRGLKKKILAMAEENARILSDSKKESACHHCLEEIAGKCRLHKVPERIGVIDISNISGDAAVGSFIFWSDGHFRKENYRHIRMDAVKGPDDYGMMREMVRRIIRNLEGSLPDLLIIDGGKAHLNAALEVVQENGVAGTDLISIAKDPDRVFLPDTEIPLSLEDSSPSSLLLRKLRDEAHRFAIQHHKKLRARKTFESPLEKIPGIGRKRRFALLSHFGSIEAIRASTAEDIANLKGFNRNMAERILESLKNNNKR